MGTEMEEGISKKAMEIIANLIRQNLSYDVITKKYTFVYDKLVWSIYEDGRNCCWVYSCYNGVSDTSTLDMAIENIAYEIWENR